MKNEGIDNVSKIVMNKSMENSKNTDRWIKSESLSVNELLPLAKEERYKHQIEGWQEKLGTKVKWKEVKKFIRETIVKLQEKGILQECVEIGSFRNDHPDDMIEELRNTGSLFLEPGKNINKYFHEEYIEETDDLDAPENDLKCIVLMQNILREVMHNVYKNTNIVEKIKQEEGIYN